MDAYEDTLRAFDSLITWLRQDPHREYSTYNGSSVYSVRRPGEYGSEMVKRSNRVASCVNHLVEDGLRVPNTYVWRRFREAMESGCYFEADGYGHYDREGQNEMTRIIESTKSELMNIMEPKPKVKESKAVVAQPRPSEKPPKPKKDKTPKVKAENVGYAWPYKAIFSFGGAGLFFWQFPHLAHRLQPTVEHNTAFVLAQIATTLTLFGGLLTLSNTIRKP